MSSSGHSLGRALMCAVALATAVVTVCAVWPESASAATPSTAAPIAYQANVGTASTPTHATRSKRSNGNCSAGSLLLNAINPFSHCNLGAQAANGLGQLPGDIAGAAGSVAQGLASDVMDQVTAWMVKAAQTISGWVVKQAGEITKPELNASWYLHLFAGLAALGGALAGLVALIALGSAAIRKDPDALGDVIYGIGRAGIGTSVVVALTIIALTAADGISNEFARQMPAAFYKTLASQWGGSGWGGFGAAALAFLVALVATIAGLLVWIELIVREAAIYVAVLFFPVALAASIWPALRMWVRRLAMLLLMFVMLRPVVVIVLALAGSVTSAGLSFGSGSIPHSVGTILAGVVIFALASFAPWALMFLLGTEVGAMNTRAAGGRSSGSTREASGAGVGGTLATGQLALAGGGTLGSGAGGPAGDEAGSATDGGRGFHLPSLGGSGSGAGGSAGPIAAAAGWVGGVAGTVGRTGGHIAQHAAAQVHVAAGRGGVAPGRVLPPSEGGPDVEAAGRTQRQQPEPPSSGGSPPADAPSPVDSSGPPPAPDAPPTGELPPAGQSPSPPAPEPSGAPPDSSPDPRSDPDGRTDQRGSR